MCGCGPASIIILYVALSPGHPTFSMLHAERGRPGDEAKYNIIIVAGSHPHNIIDTAVLV